MGGETMNLLEIRGLVKRFGGLAATDGVDLDVRQGEIHAVIGPNGAGKTTLIGQVCGTLAPDAGRILLAGIDATRLAPHQRAELGLARSYQITSIFPSFNVIDNVALAVQARSGSSFRFWQPVADERQLADAAQEILNRVGLGELAQRTAGALSHGEHRQLEMALALATRPKLLLLDEPMAGMGSEESARMVDLIAALRGEYSVLLVEHDMDAVFRLADRISVLVAGKIIATGSVAEIRDDADVRLAYLGEDEE